MDIPREQTKLVENAYHLKLQCLQISIIQAAAGLQSHGLLRDGFVIATYRQAKEANVTAERHDEKAPGHKILSEPIKNEVSFQLHPGATQQTKNEQMVRFQCNKGKNWGPRSKAKGSINSTLAGFYAKTQETGE
ncbi:hypothetical protein ANCCAN_27135 [Ancylostoma caninum]|uniref:Uncharacterized protein n=1 Tax=Ancylostoma caninum TaxID=29170 RepID=A0A368F4Z9_ANCCA|nr:hypothetical protein ANCCAN_27135 [Ancylostoma caninum]